MKKLIASLAAVALLAAPALAELSYPGKTIPKGSYTVEPIDVVDGTRHDPANLAGVYNNLQFGHAQTQYRIPNNVGTFVGDDLHMTGNTITGYRWAYSDPGVGSHSSSMAFFNMAGPADGGPLLGNTVTFVSGTMVYGAVFNVSGLPQATVGNPNGSWLITVGLPTLVTANDIWVGFKSDSTTVSGPNTLGLRGTNLAPNSPAGSEGVGSSHNLHWSGFFPGPCTTVFFSHQGGGNFRMAALGDPDSAKPPPPPPCCDPRSSRNGDWDGDCDVDLIDYSALQICGGRHSTRGASACLQDGCSLMDVTGDDLVNRADLNVFVEDLGCNGGPLDVLPGCDPDAGTCDAWATGQDLGLPFGGTYFVFGNPPNPPPGYDFNSNGNPPLPADFFGPGSLPFDGVVSLAGQPVDFSITASSDTIIEHPPLRFGFGDLPLCDIVPARLNSLSLRSREPIVVMMSTNGNDCNGNGIPDSTDIAGGASRDLNTNGVPDECEWYVAAELSQTPAPDGVMTACKTHPNGGTFDATIYVQPLFVFVNKAELDTSAPPSTDNVKILDTGVESLPPIIFEFMDQPFSVCAPDLGIYTTPCSQGNFVPGVDTSGQRAATTCVSHIKPGESHYFCPPECFLNVCTYNAVGGPLGLCFPFGCGFPACPAFPPSLTPGPNCVGTNPASCPQVGYFLTRLGPCATPPCLFPLGLCVQFYGGPAAGAITCTPTNVLLCP